MKEQPLVSVLIPAFNAELYIERAVRSIMNQTYINLEINIIDDGSVDGTKEIIDRLKLIDGRINFISRENRGLARTLNELLRISKGKYCARMDADDYSFPQRIEKQVEYMEKHPEVAVLGTAICLSNTKEILFKNKNLTHEIRKVRMLFRNAGVAHPTAMFRTEFFSTYDLQYREDLVTSEDYRLWIDVILAGGVIDSLQDVMLEYRVSDSQMTSQFHSEMEELDIQNRVFFLEHIGNYTTDEKKLLIKWDEYSEKVKPREYSRFVRHLLKDFKIQKEGKEIDVEKEIVFRWVLKALFQVKYSHDFSMLLSNFTLTMFRPSILKYVVQELQKLKKKEFFVDSYKITEGKNDTSFKEITKHFG